MKHSSNDRQLSKYTAEFISTSMEESFLRFTWNENKTVTRNTLLVVAFVTIVFFIRDVIEVENRETVYFLLFSRLVFLFILLFSSVYIHRAADYFSKYHHLLFCIQMMISLAIFALAIVREMPFSQLGVNTILFILIFYQFINNRFYYTLFACGFIGFGALFTGLHSLNMTFSQFIASIFFIIPLNFLGITILRSINQTRRNEYLALTDLTKSNDERLEAIQELKKSLAEVKTLRGFLPICAKCKKIRDDEGYWNQIETYIEQHSDAIFSHGICQECADELYSGTKWYKKVKKEGKI